MRTVFWIVVSILAVVALIFVGAMFATGRWSLPAAQPAEVSVTKLLNQAVVAQEKSNEAAEAAKTAEEEAEAAKKALCDEALKLGLKCVEAEAEPAEGTNPEEVKETPMAEPTATEVPAENADDKPEVTEVTPVVAEVDPLVGLKPFTPDWTGLSKDCPTYEEVLAAHKLTQEMLEPKDAIEVNVKPQLWESCTYAIEFKEQYRGTEIPLLNGYAYDAALVGDLNQPLWGGDPEVPTAALQWGVTFRWGPSFQGETNPGRWLDPKNPRQWMVNLCKEGRYLSTPEAGLERFPYFDRVGPWIPGTGNLNVGGWTPPGIDEFIPQDEMDAACMLGGLVEGKWTFENGNVKWEYPKKVKGRGDYCSVNDPCWQTVYIPRMTTTTGGYVELWDGKAGASRKFTYSDLATLLNGSWNVDEFSYHPFGDK